MERKIKENLIEKMHTEKITNELFDDVISHSDCERKYFTVENNDIIYKRLKSELSIESLPYLGPCVDYGLGDICLEEGKDVFKFYIIDRTKKFQCEEFDNVLDAIKVLVSYYKEFEMVDNSEKMEEIFYQTLGLEKNKTKTLKPKK